MATRPRIRFRKHRTPQQEPDGTSATALQAPPAAAAPRPAATPGASLATRPGRATRCERRRAQPQAQQPGEPAGCRPQTRLGPPPCPRRSRASRPQRPPRLGAADGEEPLAGLRAWLAQVDRKLGTRTYIGLALAVIALAGAGVALCLTLSLKQDAATKDDVNALRDQVSGVQQSATQAAQDSVKSLDQRLAQLESEVGKLTTGQQTSKRELRVVTGRHQAAAKPGAPAVLRAARDSGAPAPLRPTRSAPGAGAAGCRQATVGAAHAVQRGQAARTSLCGNSHEDACTRPIIALRSQ